MAKFTWPPPWDFAGGDGPANPFDTTSVADGVHTVTAVVTSDSGDVLVLTVEFSVAND